MTSFLHGRGGDFGGTERGLTLLVLDRVAIERMSLPGGTIFQWARGLGREVQEAAKAELFPGHGFITGELERSVDFSTVPVLEGVQINVRASARHAVFYIKGTRPHTITSDRLTVYRSGPKAGQVTQGWMKFENRGETWFAQVVHHPGFRGRNFLDDAKSAVLLRRGISRVQPPPL